MQVKEENGNYICLKHNEMILLIVMDNRVPPEKKMLCNICISENTTLLNQVLSVQQAKEMIKEKLTKQTEGHKENLILLQQNMEQIRQQLLLDIDMIIKMSEQWIKELSNSTNKEGVDLIQGLQLLQQNQGQFEQNNTNYKIKIESAFKRLQNIDGITKCYQQFKNIGMNDEQIQQQINQQQETNQQEEILSYQLIGEEKQQERCNFIAFNNTGSLMVAGKRENITVWEFEKGKITFLTELQGQGYEIYCLLFSKKNQWFISGDGKWSCQSNLKCWKQGENSTEWLSNLAENKHKNIIRCIILNNDENQLLSCSDDTQIIVWSLKYETNQIDYQYTLENKHQGQVFGLSFNQSETLLVSCDSNKQLILWIKGYNGKWICQNSVQLSSELSRVCFIGETQLLVQQMQIRFTNVFKVINKQLQEQKDLQIKLMDTIKDNDCCEFPIIYNKSKEIIILKSDKYVYIIRKQSNGSFKVVSEPIDCQSKVNFGNLTEDGQYLVIWFGRFKIYKIIQE